MQIGFSYGQPSALRRQEQMQVGDIDHIILPSGQTDDDISQLQQDLRQMNRSLTAGWYMSESTGNKHKLINLFQSGLSYLQYSISQRRDLLRNLAQDNKHREDEIKKSKKVVEKQRECLYDLKDEYNAKKQALKKYKAILEKMHYCNKCRKMVRYVNQHQQKYHKEEKPTESQGNKQSEVMLMTMMKENMNFMKRMEQMVVDKLQTHEDMTKILDELKTIKLDYQQLKAIREEPMNLRKNISVQTSFVEQKSEGSKKISKPPSIQKIPMDNDPVSPIAKKASTAKEEDDLEKLVSIMEPKRISDIGFKDLSLDSRVKPERKKQEDARASRLDNHLNQQSVLHKKQSGVAKKEEGSRQEVRQPERKASIQLDKVQDVHIQKEPDKEYPRRSKQPEREPSIKPQKTKNVTFKEDSLHFKDLTLESKVRDDFISAEEMDKKLDQSDGYQQQFDDVEEDWGKEDLPNMIMESKISQPKEQVLIPLMPLDSISPPPTIPLDSIVNRPVSQLSNTAFKDIGLESRLIAKRKNSQSFVQQVKMISGVTGDNPKSSITAVTQHRKLEDKYDETHKVKGNLTLSVIPSEDGSVGGSILKKIESPHGDFEGINLGQDSIIKTGRSELRRDEPQDDQYEQQIDDDDVPRANEDFSINTPLESRLPEQKLELKEQLKNKIQLNDFDNLNSEIRQKDPKKPNTEVEVSGSRIAESKSRMGNPKQEKPEKHHQLLDFNMLDSQNISQDIGENEQVKKTDFPPQPKNNKKPQENITRPRQVSFDQPIEQEDQPNSSYMRPNRTEIREQIESQVQLTPKNQTNIKEQYEKIIAIKNEKISTSKSQYSDVVMKLTEEYHSAIENQLKSQLRINYDALRDIDLDTLKSYIRQVEVAKEKQRNRLEDMMRKTNHRRSFEDSLNFSQTDVKIVSQLQSKLKTESKVEPTKKQNSKLPINQSNKSILKQSDAFQLPKSLGMSSKIEPRIDIKKKEIRRFDIDDPLEGVEQEMFRKQQQDSSNSQF